MSNLIAVPLPDGRWLALEPEVLRDGLNTAQALGLGPIPAAAGAAGGALSAEPWLTSEELQALTKVHSTTLEARAKSGEIPSRRIGKLLRFKLSEVEAALKADA